MLCGWKHLGEEELGRIASSVIEGRPARGPRHIEVHPTNRCNANCFFCFTESHRENQALPWPALRETLRRAAEEGGLRFLRLSGGGEAFVYPEIDLLLELVGDLGLVLSDVTTNGILLERFAQRLTDIGTDLLFVSLNAHTPERYAAAMGLPEGRFHEAVGGIRAACAARDAADPRRRPTVAVQFFVWGENHRELEEMVAFGRSLGADQVAIKSLSEIPEDLRIRADDLPEFKERLTRVMEEDVRSGRLALRFDLTHESGLHRFVAEEMRRLCPEGVPGEPDFVAYTPRRAYCLMPWYSTTIAATGVVYPCCRLYELAGKAMGDLNRQSLDEVWHGAPYRRLRGEMRRLMLLRGEMERSPRTQKIVEPVCIHRFGCFLGFHLCSGDFYQGLSERMERDFPRWERLLARGHEGLVRAVHRVRRRGA